MHMQMTSPVANTCSLLLEKARTEVTNAPLAALLRSKTCSKCTMYVIYSLAIGIHGQLAMLYDFWHCVRVPIGISSKGVYLYEAGSILGELHVSRRRARRSHSRAHTFAP